MNGAVDWAVVHAGGCVFASAHAPSQRMCLCANMCECVQLCISVCVSVCLYVRGGCAASVSKTRLTWSQLAK